MHYRRMLADEVIVFVFVFGDPGIHETTCGNFFEASPEHSPDADAPRDPMDLTSMEPDPAFEF